MKSLRLLVTIVTCFCLLSFDLNDADSLYLTKSGTVSFTSEAPLELIDAESSRLGAVLDIQKKSLAFKVSINSFEGFNSPLQKEHFNENYMETNVYPVASFEGKLIEDFDLSVSGSYKVRAKGMLSIHGVDKERIINGTLIVKPGSIELRSAFDVPLTDHDILIPKIVNQKIAEIINVDIKAKLQP